MRRNISLLVWLLVGMIVGAMAGETYVINASAPAPAQPLSLIIFDYSAQGAESIDVGKAEVAGRTSLETRVGHAVLSPDGKQVYAVAAEGRTLVLLDLPSLRIRSEVPLPGTGEDLALTKDGRTLLVTTRRADSVAVISTSTNILAAKIVLDGSPHGIAVDAAGKFAYVAQTSSNRVSVVSLVEGREVKSYPTGPMPTMVALSEDGRWLAVANSGGDGISLIDLATGTGYAVRTGMGPRYVLFMAGKFYVANWGEGTVSAVDPTSRSAVTVKLEGRPQVMVPSLDGRLYVGAEGRIVILSPADLSVIKEIALDRLDPSAMIFANGSPMGGRTASPAGRLDSKNFTCGG